jgi:hypothetical protein
MKPPKLKPLHSEGSIVITKLEVFRTIANDVLIESLKPGQPGSLKVRPDGTMLDGHHRIKILQERGVDIDILPHEIIRRRS